MATEAATNSSKFPELAIKTTLGEINSVEARLPGTYPILPNTTLNTKYNVFPNLTDIVTDAPPLAYFGIGIWGFYNTGDRTQCKPYLPKPEELDLYEPIPFRCVPIDEDLSTAERNQYRMRVEKSIGGNRYWCYYLKKLEILDNSSQVIRIDPTTGLELPYEFSADYLYPKPTIAEDSGVQDGALTEVVVRKRARAVITGSEIYEAINVLYDGDLTMAKVSEWGLYSGIDHQVTGYDAAGVGFQYTESIYAQLNYKICNTGTGIQSAKYRGARIFTLGNGRALTIEDA